MRQKTTKIAKTAGLIIMAFALHGTGFRVFAQFTDDVWYFSKTPVAGQGSPGVIFKKTGSGTFDYTPYDDSGISKINTAENSLVVSSPYCGGQLLFYVQHNQLFNNQHEAMQNGSIQGNSSCADGLAACYMGDNKYLVFSVTGAYENASRGLNAYVIDMNGDNGKGIRVRGKDMIIETASASMSESIELIPKAGTNNQYWLIYRCNSVLCCRLVNVSNPDNPSVSTTLTSQIGVSGGTKEQSVTLISNLQYTKLAMAYNQKNCIDLINFNNTTGTLSEKYTISMSGSECAYGLAFSPNGNSLYASRYDSNQAWLKQFNSMNMAASTITYWEQAGYAQKGGGMKLGPDGKIYLIQAYSNYLGVISNPDITSSNSLSNRYNKRGFQLSVTAAGLQFSTGLTMPAIPLTGVNYAPAAHDDSADISNASGSEVTVNVLANDTDPDGNTIYLTDAEFVNSTDAGLASLSINGATGEITVQLKTDAAVGRTFSIHYFIKDNGIPASLCGEGLLTITAAPPLSADLTVNGENYAGMNGKAYCNTSDFVFEAAFSTMPSAIAWTLNGEEIPASGNQTLVRAGSLPDGDYTLCMTFTHSGNYKSLCTGFRVGIGNLIWTPEANILGTDEEKRDWHNAANWTPAFVPSACYHVYIPGNRTHYPQLADAGECNDIYFMQGGELGRPDWLTYNKARVQYNFGLSQTPQTKNSDMNPVLKSASTDDRMLFSAAVSNPLERESWHILSSPLRNVVSGDFAFGGFPLTFMKKFGPITKEETDYPVGSWTNSYHSYSETISPAEGFAFYMYGYDSAYGANSNRNLGCAESGSFNDLNDLTYLPDSRNGRQYGIRQVNGILELPFFADRTLLEAHRTQTYDPVAQESDFYYIYDTTGPKFNNFKETKDLVSREENNRGSYRFIAEKYVSGKWEFENPLYRRGTDIPASSEFLVGNPYMSSIDMVAFYNDNQSLIEPQFRVWDGANKIFVSYDIGADGVTPDNASNPLQGRYIAPTQGFFLLTKNDYNGQDIKFDATHISTVRPADAPSNLRRSQAEKNILRIEALCGKYKSHALIGGNKENAVNNYKNAEDVYKLFSQHAEVPEIYTLADITPAAMNFINHDTEIIVPVGIKTAQPGETKLVFSGMNRYEKAGKIEFTDALAGETVDLTNKISFEYDFQNRTKGIENGRFFLKFYPDFSTGTEYKELQNTQIEAYKSDAGISVISSSQIQNITIFDLQGIKLYENNSVNSTVCAIEKYFEAKVLIINVQTKQGSRNIKLIGK